jgi:hypothetical protein
MNPTATELEAEYREKFLALFALVEAAKPEIGIAVLFARARAAMVENAKLSYADALAQEYAAAEARTYARLALLNQCPTRR